MSKEHVRTSGSLRQPKVAVLGQTCVSSAPSKPPSLHSGIAKSDAKISLWTHKLPKAWTIPLRVEVLEILARNPYVDAVL